MKQNQKMLLYIGALTLFVALAALVFLPSHNASATVPAKQDLKDCLVCHDQAAELWGSSHHKDANVSCVVCHKLADNTGGEHPDFAKYTERVKRLLVSFVMPRLLVRILPVNWRSASMGRSV